MQFVTEAVQKLADLALQASRVVYRTLLGQWLWELYRYGPMLTSWGFWAGIADQDLCAKLAVGSQVGDWMSYQTYGTANSQCLALIDRSFRSFAVATHTLLYCTALYCVAVAVVRHLQRRSMAAAMAKEFYAIVNQNGFQLASPCNTAVQPSDLSSTLVKSVQ